MEKDSELHQRIVSICNSYEKAFLAGANSCQDLSEYAQEAFMEAEKSLQQKRYKLFVLYLKRYSDIWQFAYTHLEPKEYRLFCIKQSETAENHVM